MSTRLPASSASLALQSMGLNSMSRPMRLPASRARSMSKPTSSFFSSRNPMGGKLSSRPTTTLVTTAAGAGASVATGFVGSFLPQAAKMALRASIATRLRFFMAVQMRKQWQAGQDARSARRPAGKTAIVTQSASKRMPLSLNRPWFTLSLALP
ncbi:hypothetical protein D3C85_1481970 [compost metagenome]